MANIKQEMEKIMNKKAFGLNLKFIRKSKKLTSEQLSEICNVNPVYIRQLESGAKSPSLDMLIKLCNSLEISPDYLLRADLIANELTEINRISSKLEHLSTDQLRKLDRMVDLLF